MAARPVRIANCSGFFGDRRAAAREMVAGGPIDVLTGDWLAELTMLILARQRARRPEAGFARTFVDQMRDVLGDCLSKGIRVVANAGGVNPEGCADAVRAVAAELGLEARVAVVLGDDLLPRLVDLQRTGERFAHLETGQALADAGVTPVSANAYLGGWGIAAALDAGADVVVTGRVTDAALAVGPAAWWHGWRRDDWDALAGAVVAGHVIECGAQTTGGNFSFFQEVPGLEHAGFPVAEVAADGSSVITKHEGTGGAVTVETVTAQLLYEVAGAQYPNPDVVARFDTIVLAPDGPDRVRISGVRGEPAPPTTKVCVNYLGGFRNTVTLALVGLDIEAKAALAERTLWGAIAGGRESFEDAAAELVTGDGDGFGLLHVTVVDQDRDKVGRAFSNVATEMGLATYPGYFGLGPPGDAREFGVYWPALVDSGVIDQRVLVDGRAIAVPPSATAAVVPPDASAAAAEPASWGPTVVAPLGRLVGARSGDKGGDANVGVWARSPETYRWLAGYLSAERLQALVPETRPHRVERHDLPNIIALNFVVKGLLGRGVAASTRFDAQAKSLGERLRAAAADVPEKLLADGS
ncbi:MAG TPA: acyclic terpene utilization AtuA family protein [Acidimicrobiales bacterium]|nr:acyclic terpene utilization AtuA family protein [Acidimicrobiales bacterium]